MVLPASGKRKILFVGDDQFLRDWYLRNLRDGGYLAEGIGLNELDTNLVRSAADLVLIDLPPRGDSRKYLTQILRIRAVAPVVLAMEQEDFSCTDETLRSGAAEVLLKPVEPQLMLLILHRVLEKDRLLKENEELRGYIDLYSACQRITTQLEAEGVRATTLSALVSETGSRTAFYLDWPAITTVPRVVELLGLGTDESREFLDELIPAMRQRGQDVETYIISFDNPAPEFKNLREKGFIEALIVPLRCNDSALGVFVLLRDKKQTPWPIRVMDEVGFIARHAGLAWHNVTLYANAKDLAFQDTLTGLYNARYLRLAIEREIARGKEFSTPFAVLFLDLDDFKHVNDLYGHQVGSQLLVEISRVLRRCVRDDDVVVRYGGDEFIIVLKTTNLATAEQVAERLRTMLARHSFLSREGRNVVITTCIGICVYPAHAQNTEELIFLADRAMYKGKNSTRNCVTTADPIDLIGETVPQPKY